ncbi:MAG: hypothetical protein JO007_04560 [Alphaproteobacteria bacterium]|nr:hypothetical protein [Alphaproteobacteria bacterium]
MADDIGEMVHNVPLDLARARLVELDLAPAAAEGNGECGIGKLGKSETTP